MPTMSHFFFRCIRSYLWTLNVTGTFLYLPLCHFADQNQTPLRKTLRICPWQRSRDRKTRCPRRPHHILKLAKSLLCSCLCTWSVQQMMAASTPISLDSSWRDSSSLFIWRLIWRFRRSGVSFPPPDWWWGLGDVQNVLSEIDPLRCQLV